MGSTIAFDVLRVAATFDASSAHASAERRGGGVKGGRAKIMAGESGTIRRPAWVP